MELIAKLIFIMVMFGINYFAFTLLDTIKKEEAGIAAAMALLGTNILATTVMLHVIHPYMSQGALAFVGFVGGAVIFIVSIMPFAKN